MVVLFRAITCTLSMVFIFDPGDLDNLRILQVFPEYFTMDHIPLELAPNGNASRAPNHFRVLGLDDGNAPKGIVRVLLLQLYVSAGKLHASTE